jgi:hypothetical protein
MIIMSVELRRLLNMVEKYNAIINDEETPEDLMAVLDELDQSFTHLPLNDDDVLNANLRPAVRAKLFANRDLPPGVLVSVRLNLNTSIEKNGRRYKLQTIHPGRNFNNALGYDIAVTLQDVNFHVRQQSRLNIANGIADKHPMAAAIGRLVQKPPSLSGTEIRFNPNSGHLFVRADNQLAVKHVEEATIFAYRVFARGKITYWDAEEAPKPLGDLATDARFETDAPPAIRT